MKSFGEMKTMASDVVEKAIAWALSIANDSSHGYDQRNRWGPDYDCSSLVISAFDKAGIGVKSAGATYTGTMKKAFLKCGFKDVTSSVNMVNGSGLVRGDVLLNEVKHTALYLGDGQIVHASGNENGGAVGGQVGDQTGREICTRTYYNSPWDCILRYDAEPIVKEVVEIEGISVKLPLLKYGSVNKSVSALQSLLKSFGFDPKYIDGEFGNRTETALCDYQRARNLEVTGTTNAETWKALLLG